MNEITGLTISLSQWLESIGLDEYSNAFAVQGYDLETVIETGLSHEDYKVLGIEKIGHQRKLNFEISKLKATFKKVSSSSTSSTSSSTKEVEQRNDLSTSSFKILPDDLSSFVQSHMSQTLDEQRACNYLHTARIHGFRDIEKICWDYILKNALPCLQSPSFLTLPQDLVAEIISRDDLNCDEIYIFEAVYRWLQLDIASRTSSIPFLMKLIRFGLISGDMLVRSIEPVNIVPQELLYATFRYHASPEWVSSISQGTNISYLWQARKRTPTFGSPTSLPTQTNTIAFETPVLSKCEPWTLSMSSTYSGLPNNYETLVNDKPGYPGAATNHGPEQWIKATFSRPVLVNLVKVSSPKLGEFATGGWVSDSYLRNALIQKSMDDKEWETVYTITQLSDGFTDCKLNQPTVGKYWRIYMKNNYIATGSFIME